MIEASRPWVTFALFSYNQEKYIREAVQGALAQDYTPLEIIFSDDSSTDRTYEIMEEMVSEYTGPHRIRLNRNDRNMGIAGHLNFMMTMVRTNFLVIAAGDDFSHTGRTRMLVSAWLDSKCQIKSIYSYAEDIDEDGKMSGNLRWGSEEFLLSNPLEHARKNIGVLGATQGWDMSLIKDFPPFLASVMNEDVIIPARAAVYGKVGFVPEVLVNYRIGVGVSHEVSRRRAAGVEVLPVRLMKIPYYLFLQKFRDYKKCDVHTEYLSDFRGARAEALFPIWLRTGYRSKRKSEFFFQRCEMQYLLWELIKLKFPVLVASKQRTQFWLAELMTRLRKSVER